MNTKKGFTLAEVLLTLAIIGVVAALTIPAVITKVAREQYVVAVKKAYNTVKAVEREAIIEQGEMKDWDWDVQATTEKQFKKYFYPYFNILKDCGTTEEGCFSSDGYKRLNYPTEAGLSNFGSLHYKFITSDGISYAYVRGETASGRRAIMYIDVNGIKGPNQYGRDLFGFDVYGSELGFKPGGSFENGVLKPIASSVVDENCSSTGLGTLCTIKVLSEGAINY